MLLLWLAGTLGLAWNAELRKRPWALPLAAEKKHRYWDEQANIPTEDFRAATANRLRWSEKMAEEGEKRNLLLVTRPQGAGCRAQGGTRVSYIGSMLENCFFLQATFATTIRIVTQDSKPCLEMERTTQFLSLGKSEASAARYRASTSHYPRTYAAFGQDSSRAAAAENGTGSSLLRWALYEWT